TSSGYAPLIVHSHLRWDFVWQRPQQILSRLARRRAVLYVEEPIFLDDTSVNTLDVSTVSPGLQRVVPRLRAELRSSYDGAAEAVRMLVRALIGKSGALAGQFDRAVQWFYTPMPAPIMIGAFDERGIVYDCMDELSQFRFAPPELIDRERLLISHSDVVFTGGRRLYEAKARHHSNVHFFGCGVDVDHFAQARDGDTPVAPELQGLPKPVLGYFGVIDERLDYELIGRLAAEFPQGSIVFVGPIVKVDRNDLPNAPNIHWLGQRAYTELPAFVKGFDVCLMPFALNAATEFINPTKTLEYMAAGKPIVSTPVPDVVRNFTPIVDVAPAGPEFIHAALMATRPDPARIEAGIARAAGATWETIVAAIDVLVRQAVRDTRPVETSSDLRPHRQTSVPQTSPRRTAVRDDGTVHVG
ncbi:MAG TPA: glycosyltransferase, partial [Gemmatimonadaceae bacterium]|nr:glycosyltransferase [Gemmatimonadaceae bacterium]